MSNRAEITANILARKGTFTAKDVVASLPDVPKGTISSLLSMMSDRKLVLVDSKNGHGYVYQANPKYVTADWKKISKRLSVVKKPNRKRRHYTRRTRVVESTTPIVQRIKEWKQKADAFDRLVADLNLSESDLAPYQR